MNRLVSAGFKLAEAGRELIRVLDSEEEVPYEWQLEQFRIALLDWEDEVANV
jgi:hypothetical protein